MCTLKEEDWRHRNGLNFMYVRKRITKDRLEERICELYRRYFRRHQIRLKHTSIIWKSLDGSKRIWMDLPTFLHFRKSHEKP